MDTCLSDELIQQLLERDPYFEQQLSKRFPCWERAVAFLRGENDYLAGATPLEKILHGDWISAETALLNYGVMA